MSAKRLRELAREQAFTKHAHYVLMPNTQGHVQGMGDKEWGFSACPHPDCAALRAGADASEARPADGKYFFPLTGKPPCVHCGQPEGVQLQLGATGYSVGSGFQHTPECKQNFCPHGIVWSEDCATCDMARIEEGE